jgi:hypothetical protein
MDYFKTNIRWDKTEDPFFPYKALINEILLKLRLNDFPEEPMYTLIVNNEAFESFDDWPSTWFR